MSVSDKMNIIATSEFTEDGKPIHILSLESNEKPINKKFYYDNGVIYCENIIYENLDHLKKCHKYDGTFVVVQDFNESETRDGKLYVRQNQGDEPFDYWKYIEDITRVMIEGKCLVSNVIFVDGKSTTCVSSRQSSGEIKHYELLCKDGKISYGEEFFDNIVHFLKYNGLEAANDLNYATAHHKYLGMN